MLYYRRPRARKQEITVTITKATRSLRLFFFFPLPSISLQHNYHIARLSVRRLFMSFKCPALYESWSNRRNRVQKRKKYAAANKSASIAWRTGQSRQPPPVGGAVSLAFVASWPWSGSQLFGCVRVDVSLLLHYVPFQLLADPPRSGLSSWCFLLASSSASACRSWRARNALCFSSKSRNLWL